jgi:hypothetical protein
MFEKLTQRAGRAVVLAQEEARCRAAERIEPAHLLSALLQDAGCVGVLAEVGIHPADVRAHLDAGGAAREGLDSAEPHRAPLAVIGIDLDEVRRVAEDTFGPGALEGAMSRRAAARRRGGRGRWGHIRCAVATKEALAWALGEAQCAGDRHIAPEHLLLGVLTDGSGARLLAADGRSVDDVRAVVARHRPGAASA